MNDNIYTFDAAKAQGLAWVRWAVEQDTRECLPYPFATEDDPYGQLWFEGQNRTPSRVALTLACGDQSPLYSLHLCRTKPCCNKRHLYWGTQAQNMADKARDGTLLVGERCPASRLSAAEVRSLRSLAGSMPQRALAARFGIAQSTAMAIVNRQTWKHLS